MKNKNLDYYICPKCHNSGYYDITTPGILIICDRCGHRDSYVRCENCGVEGEFVKDLSDNPHNWMCEYCNTSNSLNDNFYKSPVKIPNSKKINQKALEQNRKSIFRKSTFVYLVLYCFLLIYPVFQHSRNFDVWCAISAFGMTSAIFILFYFILKISAYRLKEKDKLRIFIERLHISNRALTAHICIILVVFVLSIFTNDPTTERIIQTEKVNRRLITAIEERFKRQDVIKIVRIEDKYVITFSDDSVEVFEFIDD